MRFNISKQELENFKRGYELSLSLHGEPWGGSFKASIVKALLNVSEGNPSGHTWVIKGVDGGVVIDSKRRREDWIETMVLEILSDYNPESIQAHQAFVKSEEYIDTMDILVPYYESTGYFSKQIQKHKSGKALTPQSFNKMCRNKYAQKVLDGFRADPKFPAGSLVDFRANHSETSDEEGKRNAYKRAPLGLLVLSTNERIVSSAIGCKRYKVVPVGDTGSPFYVEERFLKKRKKRK